MKKFVPILFTAILMLAGCNKDTTPTLKSLKISNKEELQAAWYEGEEERELEIESEPKLKAREWGPSGHLRLKLSDEKLEKRILSYEGTGSLLTPLRAGEVKVSVTYYGKVYDSVDITIGKLRPAPAVLENKTLREIKSATTSADPKQLYRGTYTVDTISYDAYGNMTIVDNSLDLGETVKVYGSSYNMPLVWVRPGIYTYVNPNDFTTHIDGKEDLVNIEPGDTVTMEFAPFLFEGQADKFEIIAKITSFQKASRATVTGLTAPSSIEVTEYDETVLEGISAAPAGSSQLLEFTVPNEADKEFFEITNKYTGAFKALKEGTATVRVTSRSVSGISKDISITIHKYVDNGRVEEPVDGLEVALGVIRGGQHYYYNGGIKSKYYGDISSSFNDAEMVTLRKVTGGWALQRASDLPDKDDTEGCAGKYLGIALSGDYVNFKWDLDPEKMPKDSAYIGVWDDELKSLVFTINGGEYVFDSPTKYSEINGAEKDAMADKKEHSIVHFHTAAA